MIRKSIALLVSTSLLSACYSFRGPEPVIDRGRVVARDTQGLRSGYLYERFRQATLRASGCGTPNATSWATEPATLTCFQDPVTQAEIDDFMQAGYDLIYADCANYFARMGRNEGAARVTRDSIGPIAALITGIISLVRFDGSHTRDDLIGSLALATSAGRSALDVYDQHFLFGADNIDSVRGLIQDALTAHANQTFSANVNHSTFGRAASHLEDNQALCRPSHILAFVREAIASGRVVARAPSQPSPPPQQQPASQSTTSSTSTSTPSTPANNNFMEILSNPATTTNTTTSSRPRESDRVSVTVEPRG